jgi:hypothetical protein
MEGDGKNHDDVNHGYHNGDQNGGGGPQVQP